MTKGKSKFLVVGLILILLLGGGFFVFNKDGIQKAKNGENIIEFKLDDMNLNIHKFMKNDKSNYLVVDFKLDKPARNQSVNEEESYGLVVEGIEGFVFKPKYLGEYTLTFDDNTHITVKVVDTTEPNLINSNEIDVKRGSKESDIYLYLEFYDDFEIISKSISKDSVLDLNTEGSYTVDLLVEDENHNILKQEVIINVVK